MKKNFMMAAAALLVMTACNNELENSNVNTYTPLQIQGGIAGQTRAYDNVWEANDAIGIYMTSAGTTTTVESVNNLKYTTANGDGTFTAASTVAYMPDSGNDVDVYAYYPYGDVSNGVVSFDLSDQTNQAKIDLMAAKAVTTTDSPIDKSNPTVTLDFSHKLTKLVFNVSVETGSSLSLNGMTASISGQPVAITYNPLTETIATTGDTQTVDMKVTAGEDNTATVEAILLPTSTESNPAADRTVEFTVGLNVYTVTIPSTKEFAVSTKNIYNVVFYNKEELSIEASVTNWISSTNDDIKIDDASGTEVALEISKVCMIGDATPGKWTAESMQELTKQTDGTYTWTGALTAGELKFPLSTNKIELTTDNVFTTAYCLKATAANTAASGQTDATIVFGNTEPDNKWVVAESDAGNYTIIVDVDNLKVTFTKNETSTATE